MKKINFDVVDIDWEGPFQVEYDRNLDKYQTNSIPEELICQFGIYQIYGRHPVYGKDTLLYIGETQEGLSKERNFRSRLKEHLSNGARFFGHTNLSIHLGPLSLPPEIIKKVESILIYCHAPALNRHYIDGPAEGSETILVRNWSFVGSLESACIGLWED